MKVQYRESFLRDLKKLKGQPVYDKIFEFTFTTLPEAGRIEAERPHNKSLHLTALCWRDSNVWVVAGGLACEMRLVCVGGG